MSSSQSAIVVVAAVILYEGKVVVQQKLSSNSPEIVGRWECPGGKVRFGEDFVGALKREVKEELSWEVNVHRLLHAQINTYSSGVDYLVLFYHCTLQIPLEHVISERYRLVTLEQLTAFDPLPGTVEAVRRLGEVTTVREEFSFVQNDTGSQTPDETLHVMTYELGKVVEYHHKAKRYGATTYYSDENQQKETSDLISMVRMYCEQKGWSYDVLTALGEAAYLDRMEDLRKHGITTKT